MLILEFLVVCGMLLPYDLNVPIELLSLLNISVIIIAIILLILPSKIITCKIILTIQNYLTPTDIIFVKFLNILNHKVKRKL